MNELKKIFTLIIEQPIEILEDIYNHIHNCKKLPEKYINFDYHNIRHSVIVFFRRYDGDKVAFRLGFNFDELDTVNITESDLLADFDYYLALSYTGTPIQVNTGEKGKEVILISNDVAFSLGLGDYYGNTNNS